MWLVFIIFILFLVSFLPLYEGANCTGCGVGYCLENSTTNNITTCINCACPSNFSGGCCEIEPGDACDSNPCAIPNYQCINYPGGQYQCVCGAGYYGENCSEVYCNPGDGSSIYVDASANGHVTAIQASYQPIAKIPCGNGTLWCLKPTNNSNWMSGHSGFPGDGSYYELELNCANACIYGTSYGYWAQTDSNYPKYNLRPYSTNATVSGGSLLYHITQIPPERCCTICESDPNCLAFDYGNPPTNECWFFNTNITTPNVNMTTSIKSVNSSSVYQACTYEIQNHTSINAPYIYATLYINPEQCCVICESDPNCQAFTYHNYIVAPYKNHCWFYSSTTSVSNANISSVAAFKQARGVYVLQSWVASNGIATTPGNTTGLVQNGTFRSARLERDSNTSPNPYPIGQPNIFDYIRATAVSCNGCPFEAIECSVPTVPPSTTPTPCGLECFNDGLCIVGANGTSYCQCLNIWTGPNCTTFVPCAYFQSNPNYSCLNGGTCYSNGTSFPWYNCRCPQYYCAYCPSTTQQIAAAITTSSFNQEYLPFVLANMTLAEKMNASWQVNDLFGWAAFESTELNMYTDLTKWYEPSMGNCFTFNQENATKIYKLRYSGERGGLRAQLNVNQAEYLNWVYTASMLVFLHRREETIMGESVSYQIAPGEETTLVVQRNAYTRLGHPYGVCIKSKSEVKSYYNPGSAYTIDSCIRSCYQDYVQQTCGCMDPRYYMAYNATGCDMLQKSCVNNITLMRGAPSTWPECYCPPPCEEYIFDVAWTKALFKTFPAQCGNSENSTVDEECMVNYTSNIAFVNIQFPRLYHKSFIEKPKYTYMDVLSSLFNITGLMLGVSVICFAEFAFLWVRLFQVIYMNKEAINTKMDRHSVEVTKKNCFNVPTVCPENHSLQD